MKKEVVTSLSVLGTVIPSISNALPLSEIPTALKSLNNLSEIIYEMPDITPRTLEVIEVIASHDAFLIDDEVGSVYIDLSKLQESLASKVSESQKVVEISESNLVKLNQIFAQILAEKNAFRRAGTLEGSIINQIMLEKLKLEASPILEEDLKFYMASCFF